MVLVRCTPKALSVHLPTYGKQPRTDPQKVLQRSYCSVSDFAYLHVASPHCSFYREAAVGEDPVNILPFLSMLVRICIIVFRRFALNIEHSLQLA